MDSTSISTPPTARATARFPALGPIFMSADDAAYWAHRQIGAHHDRRYGGVIVQRADGKFQPSIPVPGRKGRFDFDTLLSTDNPAVAPEWTRLQVALAYEKVLQSGSETLFEYLRKVIAKGELQAVVRSAFWSPFRVDARGVKTGIGLVRWAPDNRFALGPVFAHADDAARSAQRQIGEYVTQEYLGGGLMHEATASFVAVEPLEDGPDSGAARSLFYSGVGGPIAPVSIPGAQSLPLPIFPPDYKWVAVHQFYKRFNLFVKDPGATDRLLLDNLALADLWFSRDVVKKSGVPGGSCYFSGRGGALFKFTPSFSAQETAFFSEEAKDGVAAFLARLAGVGRLEVVDSDDYWRRRGRLHSTWTPTVQPEVKPDRDEL